MEAYNHTANSIKKWLSEHPEGATGKQIWEAIGGELRRVQTSARNLAAEGRISKVRAPDGKYGSATFHYFALCHRKSDSLPCRNPAELRDEEIEATLMSRNDGVRARDLAESLGILQSSVCARLRGLERRGLAAKTHESGGMYCRWTTPDRVERLTAEIEAAMPDGWRRRAARKVATPKVKEVKVQTEPGDEPFVRRVVPAHSASPIKKTAPASVWELAL